MTMATSTAEVSHDGNCISKLPQHVVDMIAAGEVVQRPSAVIKELLENALDAGSTKIIVDLEHGGLDKITITDNGSGIRKEDLKLAATRHATSKLSTVEDFERLETFGFRGEALASISHVSRKLSITTRTESDKVGYKQSYQNGKPIPSESSPPKPCAKGHVGTTIIVEGLFYNVPLRRQAFSKRHAEEYQHCLSVVQSYAILNCNVGFICQRKHKQKGTLVDLNTCQLPAVQEFTAHKRKNERNVLDDNINNEENSTMSASEQDGDDPHSKATKQVMAHVLETNLERHLSYLDCSHPTSTQAENDSRSQGEEFSFKCRLFYSSPSYHCLPVKKASNSNKFMLIFVNERLIDCPALRRALEDAYSILNTNTTNNKVKPILVAQISVPGRQVDVNVHPTKRLVALMYQDDLCNNISSQLRLALEQHQATFQANSVVIENPYKKSSRNEGTARNINAGGKRKKSESERDKGSDSEWEEGVDENGGDYGEKQKSSPDVVPTKTRKISSSQKIRTSNTTPVGAIEPFLTKRPVSSQSSQSQSPEQNRDDDGLSPTNPHLSSCPALSLSKREEGSSSAIDMSIPGAFADAIRCTCSLPRQNVVQEQPIAVRPKRVVPTECRYSSIAKLRKRVQEMSSSSLTKKLRNAYFVGVVSHQRSLVQLQEELVLVNHLEMAKELFYQLALARFGPNGSNRARLGGDGPKQHGIHIHTLIAQALQLEQHLGPNSTDQPGVTNRISLDLLNVRDENDSLAEQVATCLWDRAEMLEEYFGICLRKVDQLDSKNKDKRKASGATIARQIVLTHLPILLDDHSPEPHGLPLFLLRLATLVDWKEERPCFHGVCRELGNYYAQLPSDEDRRQSYIQHGLFPALSYLLIASDRLQSSGSIVALTRLANLYKVFERC